MTTTTNTTTTTTAARAMTTTTTTTSTATTIPTCRPTNRPTDLPNDRPTDLPTCLPTFRPTYRPTYYDLPCSIVLTACRLGLANDCLQLATCCLDMCSTYSSNPNALRLTASYLKRTADDARATNRRLLYATCHSRCTTQHLRLEAYYILLTPSHKVRQVPYFFPLGRGYSRRIPYHVRRTTCE